MRDLRDLIYSKADFPPDVWAHLVKTVLSLAMDPTVSLALRDSWLGTTATLLRNPRKYPRDCLTLHWRPLFNVLIERYVDARVSPTATASSKVDFRFLTQLLDTCVRARRYFPAAAAPDMMAELRQYLTQPHSKKMFEAVTLLFVFFPSNVVDHLWVDELTAIWSWVDHCVEWDGMFFTLLARAAKHANQTDDAWRSRLPLLFSRLLTSFRLPIAKSGSASVASLVPSARKLLPHRSFQMFSNKKAKLFACVLVCVCP